MNTVVRALLGLVLVVPSQAPATGAAPDVVRWIAESARPLASLEPGADPADLEPLRAIVGQARIVALGEATHGSHEFFAFKRRALEFLVRELGFTDFAMETDWSAALVANEYVEHGQGDLDGAVRALSPLWRTEEYRGLLEWLRAWNADATHARKVRFHGLDLAAPGPTARRLKEYLARVDPDVADSVAPVIERLGNGQAVDEADREGLLALFDELREACIEVAGERAWDVHRQHVVALTQVAQQRAKQGHDATSFRDRCMADNARWILRTAGPGARLALSAHNGHVSRAGLMQVEGYGTIESIGRALTADAQVVTGEDLAMVVIGTAFGQGRFHAYGRGLQAFELGPPRAEAHEALLAAAGLELALLDLGAAPAEGPVRVWLTTPRPLRFVGGAFDPASVERGEDVLPCTLADEFDALFYSAGSSPSRLLEAPR